jgi:23S rRNA (pseudouridine1915-N3)-methyltransferase
MLHVTVIMVGKTREAFIRDGLAFYQKRLKQFLNLTLTSTREEKEATGLTPETIKVREGTHLLGKVPPGAHAVALTPQGREFTSEEFAAWLSQREVAARSLAFLIGGHWGLADGVLAHAHERLSLSRFTLTHELCRLVLLEQLYRAMTIKTGHPYHV